MIQNVEKRAASRDLTARLYDGWVRTRQSRPELEVPKDKKELLALGLKNFESQLAAPRRKQLEQLKKIGGELETADKVALLVMMEFPALEASTLLHKLSQQLSRDPEGVYFSKVNQQDNCGTGCGCGCAAMMDLPWVERINTHMDVKPYSIDPFNEADIPAKARDELLIRDFLESYEAIATRVAQRVHDRYFAMGRAFA